MSNDDASNAGCDSEQNKPENRIQKVGNILTSAVREVAVAIPGGPHGPVEMARRLGIDKVLASRVLKVARDSDPVAALHHAPGPEPMRRFVKAARKRGVPDNLAQEADQAVLAFEQLIREVAGDRSSFDAMLSAWLPEARAAIEVRRRQSAFRAISQLKGVEARLSGATVILHPSADGKNLDVVWLFALLGLKRLRPGACVKFASRRFTTDANVRLPRTLSGEAVDSIQGLRLDQFCSVAAPDLEVVRAGDVVHYTLADHGFGSRSACDLIFVEVNRAEMARYLPSEQRRRRHVFAEVSVPAKLLMFDALLHEDVFVGHDPSLVIYDTACEGVADPNDPGRDIDRMQTADTILHLGKGISRFRSSDQPRHADVLEHVWRSLGWKASDFRGYRCRIDYPLYGSQVVMTWPSDPTPPMPVD